MTRRLGMLCIVLCAAAPMSAGLIYPLNQTSTAGFLWDMGAGTYSDGWDFSVNASNVIVGELGVAASSTGIPITLTLWDNATQTELAQTTVSSVAYTWVFASLTTPVALSLGNSYSVIGWASHYGDVSAGRNWPIFNNTPPAAFTPNTGAIRYQDVRFDGGIDQNTYPTQTLTGGQQYGVTDIGYSIGAASSVPEPVSLWLAAAGLAVLFAMSVKKKNISQEECLTGAGSATAVRFTARTGAMKRQPTRGTVSM